MIGAHKSTCATTCLRKASYGSSETTHHAPQRNRRQVRRYRSVELTKRACQCSYPSIDLRVALSVGRSYKVIGRQRVRRDCHITAQRDAAPVGLWRENANVTPQ